MTSRKSADARKSEIVSALWVLADRIGPDRITTKEVASAVGVTQAAVFRHFPTKDDLWIASATQIAAQLREAWDRSVDGSTHPRERLGRMLDAQLAQIAAHPALPTIICSRELTAGNPRLHAIFAELMLEFQNRIVAELTAMQRTGICGPGLNTLDAAVAMIAIVQGLALRWCISGRAFSITGDGARLLRQQIDMLCQGAGGRVTARP